MAVSSSTGHLLPPRSPTGDRCRRQHRLVRGCIQPIESISNGVSSWISASMRETIGRHASAQLELAGYDRARAIVRGRVRNARRQCRRGGGLQQWIPVLERRGQHVPRPRGRRCPCHFQRQSRDRRHHRRTIADGGYRLRPGGVSAWAAHGGPLRDLQSHLQGHARGRSSL